MTKRQERAVEAIRRYHFQNRAYDHKPEGESAYEVKRFEVTETKYSVIVYSVIGLRNDEGTLASALCRDIRHIAIGPRGGLTLLNAKAKKDRKPGRLYFGRVFYAETY